MRLNHPHTETVDRPARLGISLVELLVSIGILAMLFALLLPAIGSARRTADAVQCRARMSQIGLALHSFEERNRRYPCGNGELDWHYELLPDLDRVDLFRQLQGHGEDSLHLSVVMSVTSVPVLQCPSDPKLGSWKSAINFLRNAGSMFAAYEYPFDTDGMTSIPLGGPVSSRDIPDGLSMTAYVSEQMNEFRSLSTDRRAKWRTPILYGQPNQLDLFADLCESMPSGALGSPGGPGDNFPLTFIDGLTRYDHIVRPNHASCRNKTLDSRFGAFTANSLHSGGVHVLMADGAVRFVNNNVTRVVWRGMGTRNGHETITLP